MIYLDSKTHYTKSASHAKTFDGESSVEAAINKLRNQLPEEGNSENKNAGKIQQDIVEGICVTNDHIKVYLLLLNLQCYKMFQLLSSEIQSSRII